MMDYKEAVEYLRNAIAQARRSGGCKVISLDISLPNADWIGEILYTRDWIAISDTEWLDNNTSRQVWIEIDVDPTADPETVARRIIEEIYLFVEAMFSKNPELPEDFWK